MRDDGNDRKPKLHEIFHGEVANVQNYGAFIKIPNCKRQGLVHKSQMSSARIEDPNEMLAKGEKVYCKVIAMDNDGDKISLSMKVVSQTTGADQDPNNVQSSQDEKKRRKWNFKSNNKIELGAELNTTCGRCGGRGHLTMDCFVGKGDNNYDLVPDMQELLEKAAEEELEERNKTSHKKKKKSKSKKDKKKKAKKMERKSSSSEESENEEREKKAKRKRRHRSSSSEERENEEREKKIKVKGNRADSNSKYRDKSKEINKTSEKQRAERYRGDSPSSSWNAVNRSASRRQRGESHTKQEREHDQRKQEHSNSRSRNRQSLERDDLIFKKRDDIYDGSDRKQLKSRKSRSPEYLRSDDKSKRKESSRISDSYDYRSVHISRRKSESNSPKHQHQEMLSSKSKYGNVGSDRKHGEERRSRYEHEDKKIDGETSMTSKNATDQKSPDYKGRRRQEDEDKRISHSKLDTSKSKREHSPDRGRKSRKNVNKKKRHSSSEGSSSNSSTDGSSSNESSD